MVTLLTIVHCKDQAGAVLPKSRARCQNNVTSATLSTLPCTDRKGVYNLLICLMVSAQTSLACQANNAKNNNDAS